MANDCYLRPIYDNKNISFKELIMIYAHSFVNSCSDSTLPDRFEVNEYLVKELVEEIKKLGLIISDSEIDKHAEEAYQQKIEEIERYKRKSILECEKVEVRLKGMLDKFEKWAPPTEKHYKLKELAIRDLRENIEDLNKRYDTSFAIIPDKEKFINHYKSTDDAFERIEYLFQKYKDKKRKCEENAEFVQKLKESLGIKPNGIVCKI